MIRATPRKIARMAAMASLAAGLAVIMACAAATPAPAAVGQTATPGAVQNSGGATMIAPVPESSMPGNRGGSTSYAPGVYSGYTFAADNTINGIQVSGIGRASGVPDLAIITLGVEASRDTVEGARADAAVAMDRMVAALRARKIADRDMQTRYFNIYPRYDQFGRDITGYQVSNLLTVKVRDLNAVGNIIDEVTKAGGNLTRFQGVSFTIENTKKLEEQARAAAVADLLARANQLATLTGVQLGRPLNIVEGSAAPVVVAYAERALAAAPGMDVTTPIAAGEMEVVVNLQAVFAIQ